MNFSDLKSNELVILIFRLTIAGLLLRLFDAGIVGVNITPSVYILAFIGIILWGLSLDIRKVFYEQKALSKKVLNQNKGLRLVEEGEIREVILRYIPKAARIRVIGTGRQNVMEDNTFIFQEVEIYYKTIEKRISRPTIGRNSFEKFVYHRIIPRKLKKRFKEHLKSCLDVANEKGHEASLVLVDDFDFAHTYLIIDDELIILNLENLDNKGQIDNIISFISTNPEIIRNYQEHFDRVYYGKYKITNSINLEKELLEIEELIAPLNELRDGINKLPYSSTALKHAKLEIEQTRQRIIGLGNHVLAIDHKIANGKLLNVFGLYMKELAIGDEYETVSFYEFWEDIMRTDEKKLFQINKTALKQQATITRFFIINTDWINSYYDDQPQSYDWKHLIYILTNHVKLISDDNRYTLFPFFCNDKAYHEYLSQYHNFALLSKARNKEKILFIPNHNTHSRKNTVGSTTIHFYYRGDKDNVLIRYNDYLKDIRREQKKQIENSLTNNQERFLNDIGYKYK